MNNTITHLLVYSLVVTLICCNQEKSNQPSSSKSEKLRSPVSAPEVSSFKPESAKPSPQNSDYQRLGMRGPKQRYPTLITQPEQPNPLRDKLNKAITDANGSIAKVSENFTQLWNNGISQLPSNPLLSNKDTEVATGRTLPKEIEAILRTSSPAAGQDTPEGVLHGVALWSSYLNSGLLTQYVENRSNSLPPTNVDLAVYQALDAAVREFTQMRGQNSYASFEKWEPMVKSKNPIYRLLALKAAPVSVSKPAWDVDIDHKDFNRINAAPKMNFYLSYLEEEDPIILTELMRSLGHIPLPEARQAIENFLAQQLQKGDPVFIQAAEEALKTQESISR